MNLRRRSFRLRIGLDVDGSLCTTLWMEQGFRVDNMAVQTYVTSRSVVLFDESLGSRSSVMCGQRR